MNEPTKLKIRVEVIRRYYVYRGDWIWAGPFDSREEAQASLKQSEAKEKEGGKFDLEKALNTDAIAAADREAAQGYTDK